MKIATWNVNSLRVRLPHVLDWLQQHQPDILGLQETKVTDDLFPLEPLREAGYHVYFAGQKTYNGVAVLSRQPASDVQCLTDFPTLSDPQRRILGLQFGDVYFLNLYVPNGSSLDSDKYHYKLQWLAALQAQVQQLQTQHKHVVIVGDFNIAPADADVHDPQKWAGKVLVSPAERTALNAILALGLEDCFRRFEQAEASFSWWDYRGAGFRRNHGLRIDLILASNALAQQCQACAIDTAPRALEQPSDHAPVWAEFTL